MNSGNRVRLFLRVLVIYIISILLVGALIFLPAGSFRFLNGWLFMGALFIPMFFVLIWLVVYDPELLVKRMKTNEKEPAQKVYLISSIIFSLATYIIPGLDFRFGWSSVPLWIVIASTLLMVTGYFIFFTVMRQNSYASRVIEIQDEQKLIDTGLYSVIRHPMYLGGTMIFAFSPLILDSYYGLIPALSFPGLLVMRILNEEKVLIEGLPGYPEYMKKVKHRMIPFLW